MHQPRADEKGVEVAVAPAGAPIVGVVDPDRFAHAVTHLVDNAIKFTPPGGHVEVVAAPTGAGFEVQVRDTGIGLAPADQVRAFERFFQAAPSLTRAQGGAGLGLPIAKALVEAHGGRIGVVSALGHGSTFSLRFPDAPPPERLARPGAIAFLQAPRADLGLARHDPAPEGGQAPNG